MIHVFIGTKAQLIKMAPLMRLMQDSGVEYNFVFSGQHRDTIVDLRANFGVKDPDIILYDGEDIDSSLKMLSWFVKVFFYFLRHRKRIWKGDSGGLVLNHGDTFSTLLGSLMAKLSGLKNAHIESGLRSFNYFHPFPEELTRVLVFNLSNFYFAPGEWALKNLEGYRGDKINTGVNTLYDALGFVTEDEVAGVDLPAGQYAVASIHRFENISTRERLEAVVQVVEDVSSVMPLLFILHSPTTNKLKAYGLYDRLSKNPCIELRPRYDYQKFLRLVIGAEFVVTDGGSNQEECYYLGKPCLILRHATERNEGIGENALLSKFDRQSIGEFVKNYPRYARGRKQVEVSPSEVILEKIRKFA